MRTRSAFFGGGQSCQTIEFGIGDTDPVSDPDIEAALTDQGQDQKSKECRFRGDRQGDFKKRQQVITVGQQGCHGLQHIEPQETQVQFEQRGLMPTELISTHTQRFHGFHAGMIQQQEIDHAEPVGYDEHNDQEYHQKDQQHNPPPQMV